MRTQGATKVNISFGCDHAGYSFKNKILEFLRSIGHNVIDCGCFSGESCDYADFARPVARYVSRKISDSGILLCGTGIGMSIVANKFHGVRAALCFSDEATRLAREHNDANIICLPARSCSADDMINRIKIWLTTKASEDTRHKRRVKKITYIEKKEL